MSEPSEPHTETIHWFMEAMEDYVALKVLVRCRA
jgi:hypothetical protein